VGLASRCRRGLGVYCSLEGLCLVRQRCIVTRDAGVTTMMSTMMMLCFALRRRLSIYSGGCARLVGTVLLFLSISSIIAASSSYSFSFSSSFVPPLNAPLEQVTPTTTHHHVFTHSKARLVPPLQSSPQTLNLYIHHPEPFLSCILRLGGRRESGLGPGPGRLESTGKAKLGGHALDAVRRVDVLDHGDLVAGRRSLSGDNGRVCKEELPDLSEEGDC